MNQLEKTSAEEYAKTKAIVDTVRKAVFPGADDAELMLYFHKCQTVGCHPLDGMVHPMLFRQDDGTKKVVFIVSIDVLRSRSTQTGEYDGIDEPEYEGTLLQKTEEAGEIEVPELARVKVYRKGIMRPFVGVARWKEYYPGEKKGHQWRGKPYLMLAKCAEALARRLAFPVELNKLYTADEMEATTAMLADTTVPRASTKPKVNPNDVREVPAAPASPHSIVEAVSTKNGTDKNGKAWVKYGVKIGGKYYSTFDANMGKLAQSLVKKPCVFTSEKKGEYDNLLSIAPAPPTAAPEGPEAPNVMGADEFESIIHSLAIQAGITDIDSELSKQFAIDSLADVIPEAQNKVIDYFTAKAEQAGA